MGSTSTQQQHLRPWLSALLDAKFECMKGGNPYNSFCVHCQGNAISKKEGECHRDEGHNVVSVMKASGHYALITDDIKRQLLLDCSDICVFHINSKDIVFLNSRQHRHKFETMNNANTRYCTICGWTLTTSGLFCSLGCKFRDNENQRRMEQKESEDDCRELGVYIPNPKWQQRVSRTDQKLSEDDDEDCCEIGTYAPIPKRRQQRQLLTERRRVSRMDQKVSDDDCCEIGIYTPNAKRQPQLTEKKQKMKKKQQQQLNVQIGSSFSRDEDNDHEQRFQPPVPATIINNRRPPQQLTGFRKRSRKGIPKRAPLS